MTRCPETPNTVWPVILSPFSFDNLHQTSMPNFMLCCTFSSEANYAASHGKEIIPVVVEPRYKPDGWLSFVMRDRLRYDFSRDENFEQSFRKLYGALAKVFDTMPDVKCTCSTQRYFSKFSKGVPVCLLLTVGVLYFAHHSRSVAYWSPV